MLRFRIFLSSPGDVADERALARQVLSALPKEPQFHGQVHIDEIAWDSPGSSTPLDAHITPQEAINQRRPKPSECDVVVVVVWKRMGTPLPADYTKADGSGYHSGTEWEYLDALQSAESAGKPHVLVYRREEVPTISLGDPKREEMLQQYKLVEGFFSAFVNPDKSLGGAYHGYGGPSAFKELLEDHLRELIWERFQQEITDSTPEFVPATPPDEPAEIWQGNPYRGLSAFGDADAPIFFGRGAETDDLIRRMSSPRKRFLGVVGPSGSGKSSLVAAGLLPRLKAGAIPGSQDWMWVRFTPGEVGDDPFAPLAVKLAQLLPAGPKPREIAEKLRSDSKAIDSIAESILADSPGQAELVLFADQLEELFTLVSEAHRKPFVGLLNAATRSPRLRIVVTMRADFYEPCMHYEPLVELLREGSYTLGTPGLGALTEMIERPAKAAGLTLEYGLTQRLLDETGSESGALPLLEFTLGHLYDAREDGTLTLDAHREIGGVPGAIEAHAEEAIPADGRTIDEAALDTLFRALVAVDPEGAVVRRRAPLNRLSDSSQAISDRLVAARLLTASGGKGEDAAIEVSHEAVLRHWKRLADWVGDNREFLLWRQRLQAMVSQWLNSERDPGALLRGGPLAEAETWYADRSEHLTDESRSFIEASLDARKREIRGWRLRVGTGVLLTLALFAGLAWWQYLVAESQRFATLRAENALSALAGLLEGQTLKDMLEDGTDGPEMIVVPSGQFPMGDLSGNGYKAAQPVRTVSIAKPFAVSKHEVTFEQYERFAEASGRALPDDKEWGRSNRPVINVSWDDAKAYAEWLSVQTGKTYRLLSEAEWEYVARAKTETMFWWGSDIGESRANCSECGSAWDGLQTAPVGSFVPNAFGLYDTAGNVWEWVEDCWHDTYENAPEDGSAWLEANGGQCTLRVVRGGSWFNDPEDLRSAYRFNGSRDYGDNDIGFRLAQDLD